MFDTKSADAIADFVRSCCSPSGKQKFQAENERNAGYERQRRQNSSCTARVKVDEHLARSDVSFLNQLRSYEKTGNNEEDIDAYEAAGDYRRACVIQNDRRNSPSAQTINVGSIWTRMTCRKVI
jgi:hypothetical protein